jgi:hypothetical protein
MLVLFGTATGVRTGSDEAPAWLDVRTGLIGSAASRDQDRGRQIGRSNLAKDRHRDRSPAWRRWMIVCPTCRALLVQVDAMGDSLGQFICGCAQVV